MITFKLVIAIFAFVLSGGQIVFQTFQQHHALNPKHGAIKLLVFFISCLSLTYLAKDIYADFEQEKNTTTAVNSQPSTVEINYWHKIYTNPSPEGYCDYLEKFPDGQFIEIAQKGIPNHDCMQVKLQAESEARKKTDLEAAALKAQIENETKVLAEKNAQLEKEAKDNAARIAALEQAKTENELKPNFESETHKVQEEVQRPAPTQSSSNQPSKPEAKIEESLF